MSLISYLTTIRFDFGALAGLRDDLRELDIKAPLIVTDAGIARAGLVDRLKGFLPGGQDVPVFTDTPTNPTEAQFWRPRAIPVQWLRRPDRHRRGLAHRSGQGVALLSSHNGPWNSMRPSWAASRRSLGGRSTDRYPHHSRYGQRGRPRGADHARGRPQARIDLSLPDT